MVVKCSHCNGLMRVDENALPKDPQVKVRCPHCNEIGLLAEMTASETHFESEPREKSALETSGSLPLPGLQPDDVSEPTIPPDAFRDFRFPAERQMVKPTESPGKSRLRLLILGIISLVVVAFFALLVNLVLPGPAGQSFYKGAIPEGTAPDTSTQSVPPPGR